MFIVELTYTAPLEEIDAVRRHHLSWVDDHVAGGTVIAAGRRADSRGGILVMRAPDEATLHALLDEDPYHRSRLVDRSVTEFSAGRVAPGIEHLADGMV